MFIVGHEVGGTEEVPEISFDVVGSTGNLYKTTIKQDPYCDCPDGAKGNQCKHICYGESMYPQFRIRQLLFNQSLSLCRTALLCLISCSILLLMASEVLVHALKAPAHLQYQLAFLSSVRSNGYCQSSMTHARWPRTQLTYSLTQELCEILRGSSLSLTRPAPSAEENNGNRKPVDGDCPICFQEMIEATEKIVWCKAACGNNLHKQCFDQWAAASRTSSSAGIRCVYCRSSWKSDAADINVQSIRKNNANTGPEGYVNMASEFGLSTERGMGPSL
ncbi:RING finger domain protein [Penicillium waksmanii]|uniref:RING finger domain protein n=1 Tax=Penicillium waksmanii TaxID=69791 RepID=UPI00254694EE|nr:RING finger domain protein [Penicillium waksmanii]KAJ6000826.1 RING finger domain protein [Penicillium waksmanii]